MTRPTAVIAGANGFVGRALIRSLMPSHHVVGLTRGGTIRLPARSGLEQAEWRRADLFSLRETEAAIRGADIAYYLVHSMLPSARLTQARFEDLDLILADNFARGCKKAGIDRIVYLGGLIPEEQALSPHLGSRLEVERTLSAHGAAVTALRAGLVVGRGGSSFQMLVRLVKRLPIMVLPAWTQTRTQPIDLRDMTELLVACAHDPSTAGQTYDVGGPDVISYRQMLLTTAQALGRRVLSLSVPFLSPGLSRLWVSAFSGYPRALVGPLVMSLQHSMVARSRSLQEKLGIPGHTFRAAVDHALQPEYPASESIEVGTVMPLGRELPSRSRVRSVQRLPVTDRATAEDVAAEYLRWLPRFFRRLVVVRIRNPDCAGFYLRWLPRPLLELKLISSRSGNDRQLFIVQGGLLADVHAHPRGRLEFRTTVGERHMLAAIHDFKPRLPWFVYRVTQALVHVWVMRAFGRHLEAQAARHPQRPSPSLAVTKQG